MVAAPSQQPSLVGLASDIAAGRLAAIEATGACLAALEGRGADLNCVTRIDRAGALDRAARLDADRSAGQLRGPLHGVPLAHKDMFDRAGSVAQWGSRRESAPASETAAVLVRLEAAGAVDLGSLHMTEFALESLGLNDHWGACANPRMPDRICGGSSSGLAAAVAAGLIPAGIGSDTGGSIRIPSAFCGVFGLKPTNGLVEMKGAMPLAPTLDCLGPIARSPLDLGVLMSVLTGGAGRGDAWTSLAGQLPAGLRAGVLGGYFAECNAPEVDAALSRATAGLNALGIKVQEAGFARIEECLQDVTSVARFESGRSHGHALSNGQPIGRWTVQRLQACLSVPEKDHAEALRRRPDWQRAFEAEAFGSNDFLLCATIPVPAPTRRQAAGDVETQNELVAKIGRNTRLFNYLGLPALSLPFPEGEEMIGLQLIARPGADALLLAVAHHLCAARA